MESQQCYLCRQQRLLDDFIVRRDGIRYRMCRQCNSEVQAKRRKNPKLRHTRTHRTCYKCMRLLEKEQFTRRSNASYYSACKDCNKYEFAHLRRSRLRKSTGRFTKEEFETLLKEFDTCPMCGRKWEEIPYSFRPRSSQHSQLHLPLSNHQIYFISKYTSQSTQDFLEWIL